MATSAKVSCPKCGGTLVKALSAPDKNGVAKFGCTVCKHQFKAKAYN